MNSYMEIKKNIENRLAFIGNDMTKQSHPDEVNCLLCNYRELLRYENKLYYTPDFLTVSYNLQRLADSIVTR